MEDQPAARGRLLAAPLTPLGRFSDASNATFLVHLSDRGVAPNPAGLGPEDLAALPSQDLGIWKPVAGQAALWDFDSRTLPRREVATCLVDRHLGTDLVPETVWREGPHGPGSLQAHVPHDPSNHLLAWLESDARDSERLAALVVLDLVVNNTDRKSGHVLVAPDGDRIWAIDHGVTFHRDDKVRTVAWQLGGKPIPAGLRAAAERLATELDDDGAWLRAQLDDDEVGATAVRARRVARGPTFPELEHRGQLPWPLV